MKKVLDSDAEDAILKMRDGHGAGSIPAQGECPVAWISGPIVRVVDTRGFAADAISAMSALGRCRDLTGFLALTLIA